MPERAGRIGSAVEEGGKEGEEQGRRGYECALLPLLREHHPLRQQQRP